MRPSLSLFIIACTLAAAGCAATAPVAQPQVANQLAAASAQQAQVSEALGQVSQSIEGLSGQLLAMQDQILTLKRQSLEQSQQLASLQSQNSVMRHLLVEGAAKADTGTGAADMSTSPAYGPQLDQLLSQVSALSLMEQGEFSVVSCYTALGKWILIRYNEKTGEAWLADNGQWRSLADEQRLPEAQYRITLVAARQDQKGYVAGRINRMTGKTWWLNKNRWVEVTE